MRIKAKCPVSVMEARRSTEPQDVWVRIPDRVLNTLMEFFTEYNRFTTKTGVAHSNNEKRLNQRYQAIIEWNKNWIAGKRVLDIASHDGRWAFAAIKAGATHVTCVEPRENHVTWIHENMKHYGVSNYEVAHGDIHEEIVKFEPHQFDLVFCLGFFYHTLEHAFLFRQLQRLKPEGMIFDTAVAQGDNSVIILKWESADSGLCAYSDKMPNCLVGWPSQKALEEMFIAYGFGTVDYFDWSVIDNPPPEYIFKSRVKRLTLRTRREIKVR